jgi:hypothetical protein
MPNTQTAQGRESWRIPAADVKLVVQFDVVRLAFFVQQDAGPVDDELGLGAVTQVTALRAAAGSPLALDQAQRWTCLNAGTGIIRNARTCLIRNAGIIRNAPPDREYPQRSAGVIRNAPSPAIGALPASRRTEQRVRAGRLEGLAAALARPRLPCRCRINPTCHPADPSQAVGTASVVVII